MTRLVGVRPVCDSCLAAAATHFCVDHQTVLCASCNVSENHSTHPCIDLASAVTALPFCDHCDDAPATTYCQAEGSTLCDACDRLLHSSNPSAYSRTPIESTLRNRAVEFRGTSRASSTPTPSSKPTPRSKSPTPPSKSPSPPPISIPPPSPSNRLPVHPVSTASKAVLVKPAPPTPPLAKRRASKQIAKRKTRDRDRLKSTTPALSAASLSPELSKHTVRPQSLPDPAQDPALSFPPGVSTTSTRHPPSSHALTPHPLHDPLLGDPATFFRQEQDRNLYTESDAPLIHNLDPILTYGSLDLHSTNALDPLAGVSNLMPISNSPPGISRRTVGGSQDMVMGGDRTIAAVAAGREPSNTPQPNVVAAAAAAAAAAAESFLLNSVSSGSRSSSGERAATPMNEGPDPAGVAEVATAAAESAVAAGDFVGGGRALRFGEEVLEGLGNQSGRVRGRGVRRSGVRRDSIEEEVRKLDMDSAARGRARAGVGLSRHRGDVGFLGQVHGEEDVLRGGGDMMGDLEIGGGEFGFDAMDLGGVDLQSGFSLPDYRTRELDWDEGG